MTLSPYPLNHHKLTNNPTNGVSKNTASLSIIYNRPINHPHNFPPLQSRSSSHHPMYQNLTNHHLPQLPLPKLRHV